MANEKRLMDANALWKALDEAGLFESGNPRHIAQQTVEEQPTVDAVILPCKVRDSVWLIQYAYRWNGFRIQTLEHPMQRDVLYYRIQRDGLYAHFYDGCISLNTSAKPYS